MFYRVLQITQSCKIVDRLAIAVATYNNNYYDCDDDYDDVVLQKKMSCPQNLYYFEKDCNFF